MMKYSNHFILLTLLLVGFFLRDSLHLSTNLLSLFASKESVQKLNIANNLGYSKELLIAVKGFDKESKKRVRLLAKELQKIQEIEFVQYKITPTPEIQEYFKNYYPLLANFSAKNLSQESVKTKLETLYLEQFNSIFYTSVNKNDPLGLFTLPQMQTQNITHKGDYISLGEYGYLIRALTDISPSQMQEAKVLYDKIQKIVKPFDDIVAFAPFFYTVENSTAIKGDVQWIVLLSTIVLLIIYYLLIKNLTLLRETLVALFSSMLFAALIATTVFENFNVLSLAFGMSLTAVSIDYLLHYHFHNFYKEKQKIDRNVLYGFLTTVTAFGIFTFIPIPLISQISFFAVLSLSFAYFLFTFVFPLLELKSYNLTTQSDTKESKGVNAKIFFAISLLLFAYSVQQFRLDTNIRNLDYQNTHLREAEGIFKKYSSAKLLPVVVSAESKEVLIQNLNTLKEHVDKSFSLASFILDKKSCQEKSRLLKSVDFDHYNSLVNRLSHEVGFKEGYFKDAYKFTQNIPSCQTPSLKIFKTLGLNVYDNNQTIYTMAFVDDAETLKELPFASSIDVKAMFKKSANGMYESLLIYGFVVLLMVFLLLFVSVKKKLVYALNYILFPLALTMAILTSFTTVNIMHLFSLIILVAIGIDYGIYMSNSLKPQSTMLAIKYSLLSTFAAFGVLIFSSIVALNSIGVVISLGCMAIFILIKVMR